jgi:hypothetical protein
MKKETYNLLKTVFDLVHFLYGMLCGWLYYYFKPLCGILTTFFIVYQILEKERRHDTVRDMVTFLAGFFITFTSFPWDSTVVR